MREAITHELAAVGELTAKGIAAALDFEVADVINELNDMLKNGLVERTKRYGNEYTYWLTQPVVATSNEIPVFAGAKPASGASNPGSSGTDSPSGSTSSPGAAASIQDDAEQRIDVIGQNGNEGLHYLGSSYESLAKGLEHVGYKPAIHAEHAAELQAALDEIDRLKRALSDARSWQNYSIEGAVKAVQSVLEEGIFLTIHEDDMAVFAFDNGYSAKPDELVEVVSMCADLERRLVA